MNLPPASLSFEIYSVWLNFHFLRFVHWVGQIFSPNFKVHHRIFLSFFLITFCLFHSLSFSAVLKFWILNFSSLASDIHKKFVKSLSAFSSAKFISFNFDKWPFPFFPFNIIVLIFLFLYNEKEFEI